jgi:hypothetical protein
LKQVPAGVIEHSDGDVSHLKGLLRDTDSPGLVSVLVSATTVISLSVSPYVSGQLKQPDDSISSGHFHWFMSALYIDTPCEKTRVVWYGKSCPFSGNASARRV